MKKIFVLFSSILVLVSQNRIDIDKSKLTIDGTSTLHDWTSVVESYHATTDLIVTDDNYSLSKFDIIIDRELIQWKNLSNKITYGNHPFEIKYFTFSNDCD